MKLDPRTALAVSLPAMMLGLLSRRGAAVAIAGLCVEALAAGVRPRALVLRLAPLASGFTVLLLLLPFAPGAVLDVALRGLAVSLATVVAGAVTSWSGLVGALQGLGLPRAAIAFLVILARHAEELGLDARHAHRALVTRGGYDRAASLGRSTAVLLARILDRALHRADHVARALELRGFQGRVPAPAAWRPRPAEAPHYGVALLLLLAALFEVGPWSR
jgi:cobalt/nickel transport system permease protein